MKMGILLLLIVVISIVLNITEVEGKNHLIANLTRDTTKFKYIDIDSQLTLKQYDDNLTLEIIKDNRGIFNITSNVPYHFISDVRTSKEWGYKQGGREILESNASLFLFGSYICIDTPRIIKENSLAEQKIYDDCIYYPSFRTVDERNSSIEIEHRNFTKTSNTSYDIFFPDGYDPTPSNLTIGLIACYDFDSGYESATGDYSLSITAGAPFINGTSKIGNGSVYFDGSNNKLSNLSFDAIPEDSEFTFSVWTKPDSIGGDRILFATGNGDITIFEATSQWRSSTVGYGDNTILGSSKPLNETWQMLTLVINRTGNSVTKKIYVNGSLEDTEHTTGNITADSDQLNLGEKKFGAGDYDGHIDRLVIYNVGINSSFVSELYNGSSPPDCAQIIATGEAPPADDNTCIDAYTSGDFVVDCSQLCIGNASLDIGNNNFILNGQGNYSIEADMTVGDVIQDKQCLVILNKNFNFDFTK